MEDKLFSSGGTSVLSQNSCNESQDVVLQIDNEDTCSAQELDALFQTKWKIDHESVVSLKEEYILHLAADNAFTRIASGLSSTAVHIFDINVGLTLSTLSDILIPFNRQKTSICGVRFLDETSNCLLVGSTDGIVRLFDLRTEKEQACFMEGIELTHNTSYFGGRSINHTYVPKNINCFDSNSNGRILCTGTEQSRGNVFLLFYDIRERKQLGGYYESHEDDITAISFHSLNPDLMCSGSTDGLINVYDIKETIEDDALLTTINTENSVGKLKWHKNVYEQDVISCITHTNDFHIYLAEEGDLVAKFGRCEITKSARLTNEWNCNVIDAHSNENGDIFLLTGSNDNNGDVMRSLRFNNNLLPMSDFKGNKQLVRASILNNKNGVVVTGGESGFVTIWSTQISANEEPLLASSSSLKLKSKKSKKEMPY